MYLLNTKYDTTKRPIRTSNEASSFALSFKEQHLLMLFTTNILVSLCAKIKKTQPNTKLLNNKSLLLLNKLNPSTGPSVN